MAKSIKKLNPPCKEEIYDLNDLECGLLTTNVDEEEGIEMQNF